MQAARGLAYEDVPATERVRKARHPEPACAQVAAAGDALHGDARAADDADLRAAQPAACRHPAWWVPARANLKGRRPDTLGFGTASAADDAIADAALPATCRHQLA